MARDILVPLDGSTFSEHALPAAADLARRTGARLHLVQVHEPVTAGIHPDGIPVYDTRWEGALRAQEEEYLRGVAGQVASSAGVSPVTELLDGPVTPTLCAYVAEAGIGQIVMTTHGRGGISRAWLGSIADALVRRASVPVLLFRPLQEAVEWKRQLSTRHVLVPLDGSELAEGILDPALELGTLTGARFTLLRIVLPLPFVVPSRLADPTFSETGAAQSKDLAARYLASVAQGLRARGARVDFVTMFHTSPAHGIIDYAATHAVDLIAMATHGRGGWKRVALGSVADKVMRGTTVPLLLLRPARSRKPAPVTDAASGATLV
jgi:nucleotide-binding universal stress UspA family protein